jgi:hypothetical protein
LSVGLIFVDPTLCETFSRGDAPNTHGLTFQKETWMALQPPKLDHLNGELAAQRTLCNSPVFAGFFV